MIELHRSVKGIYYWSITVEGDDTAAVARAVEADEALLRKYPEPNKPEAPEPAPMPDF